MGRGEPRSLLVTAPRTPSLQGPLVTQGLTPTSGRTPAHRPPLAQPLFSAWPLPLVWSVVNTQQQLGEPLL